MRVTRKAVTLVALVAALVLSGCTEQGPSAAQQAADDRNAAVENIRKEQRVEAMDYSPTLDTINRWVKTWEDRNAVSYVYMQRADGSYAGYYVLDGLPVNYCVGGSPPYDIIDSEGDGDSYPDRQVPAPGLDGAYYGGCDASRYYGFDAVTGQYVEYTDGLILTAVLSNQPIPVENQPPAFVSSIEDVKRARQ